jgi:hypothetical protein
VMEVFRTQGAEPCAAFLDKLKKNGFEFATTSGATVSMDDMIVPADSNRTFMSPGICWIALISGAASLWRSCRSLPSTPVNS